MQGRLFARKIVVETVKEAGIGFYLIGAEFKRGIQVATEIIGNLFFSIRRVLRRNLNLHTRTFQPSYISLYIRSIRTPLTHLCHLSFVWRCDVRIIADRMNYVNKCRVWLGSGRDLDWEGVYY